MLGAADSITALLSQDALLRVRGPLRSRVSTAFEDKMEEATENLLRDAACDTFANEMNQRAPHPTFTPLPGQIQTRTRTNLYDALVQSVIEANYSLEEVQRYVNLSGLSSQILTTATGYVGKIKKTVTASTWQNGGAARTYLQFCLLPRKSQHLHLFAADTVGFATMYEEPRLAASRPRRALVKPFGETVASAKYSHRLKRNEYARPNKLNTNPVPREFFTDEEWAAQA